MSAEVHRFIVPPLVQIEGLKRQETHVAPRNSDRLATRATAISGDIATIDSPSAVVALLQATKAIVSSLTSIGSEFDLTCDDVLVLDALARHGSASMAELSSHTAISGATLTRSVDRLVSRTLVYREVSAEDRRRVEVHLSTRGAETHRALEAQLAELDARAGRICRTPSQA